MEWKFLIDDNLSSQPNFVWNLTLLTSGDQIQAGDTELTLILYWARSSAMFLVRMLMAPLLAAYVHLISW